MEERELGAIAEAAAQVLSEDGGHWKAAGTPEAAVAALGQIPAALADDIQMLATRLAALMQVDTVTIRLEVVSTNACRKIHADNTDLRLITTYAGPGTQVLPPHSEVDPNNLWTMPTGWVGLFKGRAFGEGHEACLHRSPPMGDMGGERLVLVIDTPAFAREGACA
ncbi:DUF1826 domain-containing protein [Altericroceibacterium endophyticum]|uniref:DUF1826 domain-containing protein n=1 Tax=Altericroceibacterium endophyticum TaxID=1808508 RepID=A0A6I4T5S8_9SPHN|nr:DUF1826 domain-containing protein [Altericroceibacterium endophyticum]